jgi:uncharacterized membrane-anchored protein YitT (DUF2179 family)
VPEKKITVENVIPMRVSDSTNNLKLFIISYKKLEQRKTLCEVQPWKIIGKAAVRFPDSKILFMIFISQLPIVVSVRKSDGDNL